MFENMTSDDFAIFNKDDELASKQAKNINGPHFLWFSRKEEVEGAFVKDGRILFRYAIGKKIYAQWTTFLFLERII